MRFFWLAIFLALIFVFIQFQIVWLAILLGLVIVVDLLSRIGRKGVITAKVVGKGIKEDLKREYKDIEEKEGEYPKKELFVSLFSEAGKRVGEEIRTEVGKVKPKEEIRDESLKRLGNGASEFIKVTKKVFKKK